MEYFGRFYTDQVKFPHGGAHARGHRSDVLVVARRLLKKDARTLDELGEEITESYTPKVEVQVRLHVW